MHEISVTVAGALSCRYCEWMVIDAQELALPVGELNVEFVPNAVGGVRGTVVNLVAETIGCPLLIAVALPGSGAAHALCSVEGRVRDR